MIFDTNILIYLSKNILRITDLLSPGQSAKISTISYIEAMGFASEVDIAERYMQSICDSCSVISLSGEIVQATVYIRRNNRIKLPDAVIYATALVQQQPLLTRNVADFKSIGSRVQLIDPFTL